MFYRVFGRFVTTRVQKHEEKKLKIHLGSSQKMRGFFPPFFFHSAHGFCSIFLSRFLGVS
jgi:hypothetical protein